MAPDFEADHANNARSLEQVVPAVEQGGQR